MGSRLRHLVAACVLVMVALPGVAMADDSAAVTQFIANPTQALQDYPSGGPQLISLIRDVALAHPEALQTIVGLLANATADQQTAIGSGLGQAAQMSLRTNQAYANQIQQALIASGFQNAITAFAGVTGNVNIASTGPGGGGGGGGVGGSTGANGSPSGGSNSGGGQTFGSSNFQTSSQNFFTGGGSGGATSSSGSVSPR